MAAVEALDHRSFESAHEIESDVEPENVPLPRSSMVSVRLSDIPFDPELDIIDERDVLDASIRRSDPPSTRTSRSSSRTSESSISINSVNWEDLEKTEEQQARDDAKDEVGLLGRQVSDTANQWYSQQRCYWRAWTRKMRPWPSIQKPALQHLKDLARILGRRPCTS